MMTKLLFEVLVLAMLRLVIFVRVVHATVTAAVVNAIA
jgi:hypothetical protein